MLLVPVIAMAILMGVLPNLFLKPMAPSIEKLLTQVHRGTQIRVEAAPQADPATRVATNVAEAGR